MFKRKQEGFTIDKTLSNGIDRGSVCVDEIARYGLGPASAAYFDPVQSLLALGRKGCALI